MSRRINWPALLTGVLFMTTAPVFAQDDEGAAEVTTPPPVPEIQPERALDTLQEAYQKEYAFLEAQIRDLQQRLASFQTEADSAEAQREAAIDRAEAEWINMQSRAERLQDLLTEADREIEAVDEAATTLEATFLQAQSTLEQYDIEEIQSEAYFASGDGEKVETLFANALELLRNIGNIREETGTYFLPDGREVQGEIIRVGNIAAYGISSEGAGALVPAGEGRLKVWSEPATETATALAAGNPPDVMGMFLYESDAKAIEEQEGKTLLSVINSGGTIGWIIVGLGILALIMVILRFLFLRRASSDTDKLVARVGDHVKQGDIEGALDETRKTKGSTSQVLAAAVRNLDRDREHIEDIVSEQILHESGHLNRFGGFILVIAAVAPLLGLLGTVTGMITTFDIITEFGTGDPKLLSSGISIALVTTELGLAVAIPALLFGNILSGWAESIKDGMEKGALRVINLHQERARPA